MSLVAASLMKSSVFGAIPKTELTPVFSAADCANAGDDKNNEPKTIRANKRFMTFPFKLLQR